MKLYIAAQISARCTVNTANGVDCISENLPSPPVPAFLMRVQSGSNQIFMRPAIGKIALQICLPVKRVRSLSVRVQGANYLYLSDIVATRDSTIIGTDEYHWRVPSTWEPFIKMVQSGASAGCWVD